MERFDEDYRRSFEKRQRRRAGHGIKALVPTGVLVQLIRASRKHCAICKVQLDAAMPEPHPQCDGCKLRVTLDVAEKILKKFDTRNKLAYQSRERRRALEKNEELDEFTPPVQTNLGENQRPTRW